MHKKFGERGAMWIFHILSSLHHGLCPQKWWAACFFQRNFHVKCKLKNDSNSEFYDGWANKVCFKNLHTMKHFDVEGFCENVYLFSLYQVAHATTTSLRVKGWPGGLVAIFCWTSIGFLLSYQRCLVWLPKLYHCWLPTTWSCNNLQVIVPIRLITAFFEYYYTP